jgi:hypothetical protein
MAERKRPPYTSAADVHALFEGMRTKQAPKKIDTEWAEQYNLAPKQPEAVPKLLRWLGIIDKEGVVTAESWDSVRVPRSRAAALNPLVRSAYSDVFERIDVEQATQDDLSGAFINAYRMGDPRKQVRCFLVLCEMAGIQTAAEAKTKPGPASGKAVGAKGKGRNGSKPRETSKRGAGGTRKQQNRQVTLPQSNGVIVTLAIEIPADWNEDQIRDRLVTVSRVLGEAGLGAA